MITPLRSRLRNWVPPWLSDRAGRNRGWRVLFGIALACDATIEFFLQAVLARLPGEGPEEALPLIGRDRRITRGYAESVDAYVERLIGWRPSWRGAGNAYTVMRQVRGYLSPHKPRMRVFNGSGCCYTLNPDDTLERHYPTSWDWDGNATLPSRCWLVIYNVTGLFERDGEWGDPGTWAEDAEGETWGSMTPAERIAAIRRIVDEWKSAATRYERIIVAFDDAALDPEDNSTLPDGTWGHHSTIVGGVSVAARDPRSIYWTGVA